MSRIAITILAAGQGSRMEGATKQLVRFGDDTLVTRAIRTSKESKVGDVFVVLGFMIDEIMEQIKQTFASPKRKAAPIVQNSLSIVPNMEWAEGIASSIRMAVHAAASYDAVIFMTVDQPFVDQKLLVLIRDSFVETRRDVVASAYGTPPSPGIPALFSRSMFPSLSMLQGDRGAKQLIINNNPLLLEQPAAAYDIDTISDLQDCLSVQRSIFHDSAFNHH